MKKPPTLLKRMLPLAVLPLFQASAALAQTPVKVVFWDGTEQSFTIQSSGKMYFNSGSLFIEEEIAGSTATISLPLIRKILFQEHTTGIVTAPETKSYLIFPNPAGSAFQINATQGEKLAVKVWTVTGREVLSGNYTAGETISVAHLNPGLYIVSINNRTFKLVKQ